MIIQQYEKQRLWHAMAMLLFTAAFCIQYMKRFPGKCRCIQRAYHTAIPNNNAHRLETKACKVRTLCVALNLEIPTTLSGRLHASIHAFVVYIGYTNTIDVCII